MNVLSNKNSEQRGRRRCSFNWNERTPREGCCSGLDLKWKPGFPALWDAHTFFSCSHDILCFHGPKALWASEQGLKSWVRAAFLPWGCYSNFVTATESWRTWVVFRFSKMFCQIQWMINSEGLKGLKAQRASASVWNLCTSLTQTDSLSLEVEGPITQEGFQMTWTPPDGTLGVAWSTRQPLALPCFSGRIWRALEAARTSHGYGRPIRGVQPSHPAAWGRIRANTLGWMQPRATGWTSWWHFRGWDLNDLKSVLVPRCYKYRTFE